MRDDEDGDAAAPPNTIITVDDIAKFEALAGAFLDDKQELSLWLSRRGLVMLQILDMIACQPVSEGVGVRDSTRAVQLFNEASARLLAVLPSPSKDVEPAIRALCRALLHAISHPEAQVCGECRTLGEGLRRDFPAVKGVIDDLWVNGPDPTRDVTRGSPRPRKR